jgi:hypothetical protein
MPGRRTFATDRYLSRRRRRPGFGFTVAVPSPAPGGRASAALDGNFAPPSMTSLSWWPFGHGSVFSERPEGRMPEGSVPRHDTGDPGAVQTVA